MSTQPAERQNPAIQEPAEIKVKDWAHRLQVAREAFELGKATMTPPQRSRPLSQVRQR